MVWFSEAAVNRCSTLQQNQNSECFGLYQSISSKGREGKGNEESLHRESSGYLRKILLTYGTKYETKHKTLQSPRGNSNNLKRILRSESTLYVERRLHEGTIERFFLIPDSSSVFSWPPARQGRSRIGPELDGCVWCVGVRRSGSHRRYARTEPGVSDYCMRVDESTSIVERGRGFEEVVDHLRGG